MATRVGGTILVIEAGHTRTDECRRSIEALARVGANLLGVVLNRVASNGAKSYYYYSSETAERSGRRSKARARERRKARAARGLVGSLASRLDAGAATGEKRGRRKAQWALIALLIIFDLAAIASLVLLLIGGI